MLNITLIIALLLATFIPLLYLFIIYKLDYFKTGNFLFVMIAFASGLFAYGGAYLINSFISKTLHISWIHTAQFITPVVEEILKAIILVILVRHRKFNYFVDAAIYGFSVGIGFAIIENYQYVTNNPGSSLMISITRVISTNLMHAASSALIGILFGLAKYKKENISWFHYSIGLFGGIFLHGIYNNLITRLPADFIIIIAIILGFGASTIIILFMRKGLKNEKLFIAEHLGDIDRVTSRESAVVQSMNNVKPILDRLTQMFGKEKSVLVHELLKHQARLGILRHHYSKVVDENIKKSTYEEITLVRDKMDRVRKNLGPWVMLYIRDVFPEESIQLWNNFARAIEEKASSPSSNNIPNLWYTLNTKTTPQSKINPGELSNQQWRSKMSKIVAIHSFRGGTGKTNITANIAAQTALRGKRVAVVDTDIQSPGIHVLFGLDDQKMKHTLNEFLHGDSAITDVALNIGENVPDDLPGLAKLKGKDIWLIPSSINCAEISRILRDGYDVNLLNQGLHKIREALKLDFLFIDTHPGLHETTLLSLAISDMLIILLRPDQQDFQGTAVTVTIARSLDVPEIWLLVNKALTKYDFKQIKDSVEHIYDTEVVGVMPLSEDLVDLGSSDIFSLRYPDHPWSKTIIDIVDKLTL